MAVPRSLKIGAVIVIILVFVLVLLPFFGLGDGWWQRDDEEEDEQNESARFQVVGVDPDGNEIILSDPPTSFTITAGGIPITEIRTRVEVRGSSPDFSEYRILSASSLRLEAFVRPSICPGCPIPTTITGFDLRIYEQVWSIAPQTLPFDDAWHPAMDNWFVLSMDIIEDRARIAGAVDGNEVRLLVTLTLAWDVVGDQDQVPTPDIVMRATAILTLGIGTAQLVGAMTCEPTCT